VGIAQAIAIEEQVRAYGGPKFQLTQDVMNRFAQAIQGSRVDVVPKIVIGGANGGASAGGTGGLLEGLLMLLLSEKLGLDVSANAPFELVTCRTRRRTSSPEDSRSRDRGTSCSKVPRHLLRADRGADLGEE